WQEVLRTYGTGDETIREQDGLRANLMGMSFSAPEILKDFPEGHEFGIDYKSWTVGPKFMGLKMIPAGVHFVYCSVKGAPRIGFFHNFKSEEIVAKKWDKVKETFSDDVISDEEVNRIRANLKNIDSQLGPYPFENYRSWYALTDFVTGETVD
ncbi:hypothetical protein TELCIR_21295, partial [Teladorsagia circumcincta]